MKNAHFALTTLFGMTLSLQAIAQDNSLLNYSAPSNPPSFSTQFEQFARSWKELKKAEEAADEKLRAIQDDTRAARGLAEKPLLQIVPNAELSRMIPWKIENCQIYKNEVDPVTGTLTLTIKDLGEHVFPLDRLTIKIPKDSVTAKGSDLSDGIVLSAEFFNENPDPMLQTTQSLFLTLDTSKNISRLEADIRSSGPTASAKENGTGQVRCHRW